MHKKEQTTATSRESATERASRFLRNINALGALLLGAGAVVAPPLAAGAFGTLAGINAIQAGGFELLRKHAQQNRLRKTKRTT